jgi:hypothetical protein
MKKEQDISLGQSRRRSRETGARNNTSQQHDIVDRGGGGNGRT